jgi:dipeptidyl aminopeptidase/acylaminoacyl peptidase
MSAPLRIAPAILLATLLTACGRGPEPESAAGSPAEAARAAPPALLPRTLLFGNPERATGRISPDGRWLAYLGPRDGVLNVYVAPRNRSNRRETHHQRPPPRHPQLVRVNLTTGEQSRVFENKEFADVTVDRDFALRYAAKQTADGGSELFVRDGNGWRSWSKVPQADGLTTGLAGITADGKTLYVIDRRDRNTGALYAVDTASGERRLVHEDARADVGGTLDHPFTGAVQAVAVDYLRNEWTAVDPAVAGDLAKLKAIGDGDIQVVSRTLADDKWVVAYIASTKSTVYYLYDRATSTPTLWFDTRPDLEGAVTAPMHTAEIESHDGLTLPSYYTLPPASDPGGDGKPSGPVPMVLFVHGGPWGRDGFGFDTMHQLLANRGYAVLAVNYRGSTGFGKSFTNAGDLKRGRKMHDDLLDGVSWAVQQGIAQKDKVAIMGGSYGG